MNEKTIKIVNKVWGMLFRGLISGSILVLFILLKIYNNNIFFSSLVYMIILIPFQTELIELEKPEGKQWRYVFSVMPSLLVLISVVIGLLKVNPQVTPEFCKSQFKLDFYRSKLNN